MDDAAFGHWMVGITGLSFSQRRRAWEGRALSEASSDSDGDNPVGTHAGITCANRTVLAYQASAATTAEHATNPVEQRRSTVHQRRLPAVDMAGVNPEPARQFRNSALLARRGRDHFRLELGPVSLSCMRPVSPPVSRPLQAGDSLGDLSSVPGPPRFWSRILCPLSPGPPGDRTTPEESQDRQGPMHAR